MHRTTHTDRARLCALALTGALLMTGCSGSDDEPSAESEPSAGVIEVSPSSDGADPDGSETADGGPEDPDDADPSATSDDREPGSASPTPAPSGTPTKRGGDVVGEVDPELAERVPDLCQAFTAADFEKVTKLPAEGAPEVPVALATVYSSCSYAGPSDHPTAVLTAYAEDEVDDLLEDGAGDDDLPLDDAEWMPRTGLLIEIDDADWTLQVRVTNRRGRPDRGLSLQVARIALRAI